MNGADMSTHSDAAIIVNELLSYTAFYIADSNVDKLCQSIAQFYVPVEIELAKKMLYESAAPTTKIPTRKDSTARTAVNADIHDIISLLKNTDTSVIYVARDMTRIPKWAPGEISLFSLADRVARLEAEVIGVKADMIEQSTQRQGDATRQMSASHAIADMPSHTSGSNLYSDQFPPLPPSSAQVRQTEYGLSATQSYSSATKSPSRAAAVHAFMPARPPNDGRAQQRKRPAPIIGKRKNVNIQGECRKTDIFIYRVSQDCNDDEIEQLFTDANITLYDFSRVSHNDAKLKSYKATIAVTDIENVCNENFLPENVMCRRFYRPKITHRFDAGRTTAGDTTRREESHSDTTKSADNAVSLNQPSTSATSTHRVSNTSTNRVLTDDVSTH